MGAQITIPSAALETDDGRPILCGPFDKEDPMTSGCPRVKWISVSFLLISLCAIDFNTYPARAQGGSTKTNKMSPDLVELARGPRASARVRVIIELKEAAPDDIESVMPYYGGRLTHRFQTFSTFAVELPATAVEALAGRTNVRFISLDRQNIPFGHVSLTTGADAVRITNGTNTVGLDGTGIGIAVLDSGIDPNHTAFLDRSNNVRVIINRDFTGEGRTDDPYGHGTHVASIAAGNARISNAQYNGIAPNANLLNLRVLGATGSGSVSATLSALDWVMTNYSTYNIRIVNMSLGAPAVESYKTDPVCRAVRRLVDAGIIVVAAAGNNGKNATGQKVYGQIHSPGNEPSAITVGAANTFGTDGRGDDTITTYSSRGPTRSYWTDNSGVDHYDNLVKPDIVAPGNKIVSA